MKSTAAVFLFLALTWCQNLVTTEGMNKDRYLLSLQYTFSPADFDKEAPNDYSIVWNKQLKKSDIVAHGHKNSQAIELLAHEGLNSLRISSSNKFLFSDLQLIQLQSCDHEDIQSNQLKKKSNSGINQQVLSQNKVQLNPQTQTNVQLEIFIENGCLRQVRAKKFKFTLSLKYAAHKDEPLGSSRIRIIHLHSDSSGPTSQVLFDQTLEDLDVHAVELTVSPSFGLNSYIFQGMHKLGTHGPSIDEVEFKRNGQNLFTNSDFREGLRGWVVTGGDTIVNGLSINPNWPDKKIAEIQFSLSQNLRFNNYFDLID